MKTATEDRKGGDNAARFKRQMAIFRPCSPLPINYSSFFLSSASSCLLDFLQFTSFPSLSLSNLLLSLLPLLSLVSPIILLLLFSLNPLNTYIRFHYPQQPFFSPSLIFLPIHRLFYPFYFFPPSVLFSFPLPMSPAPFPLPTPLSTTLQPPSSPRFLLRPQPPPTRVPCLTPNHEELSPLLGL